MREPPVDLSVVTSLYRSEPHIVEFYKRVVAALERAGISFELILVDDGFPDDALALARGFAEADFRVKVIALSRNFGQHPALLTGINAAAGAYVAILDSDLEEAPEALPKMYARLLDASGTADVVYGVQVRRDGPLQRRLGGRLFYTIFELLSDIPLRRDAMVLRVMSRRYVDGLRRFPEHNPNLGGLFALTGFNQIAYPIEKPYKGSSSYNLSRRIVSAVTLLVSFSTRPAYVLFLMGLGVVVFAAIGALLIIAKKLLIGSSVTGWSSLAVLILFSMGFSILMNGVTLLYIVEILKNVKGWPLTIIKEVYQRKPEDSSIERDR